jgi:phospholipase/lecithinase/hemolysin
MAVSRLLTSLTRLTAAMVLALGAGAAAAQAAPDRLVFFGASLTDSGNAFTWLRQPAGQGCGVPLSVPPYDMLDDLVVPDGPYAAGGHHFSNGATWAEGLARAMALPAAARPVFANPGRQARNYAVGGARAVAGYPCRVNLPAQVQTYLGDAPRPAPETWFAIEIGGNDVRDALIVGAGGGNPVPVIAAALTSLGQQIGTLYAYGARRFLLLNVPDVGATPAVRTLGPLAQAFGSQLALAYNAELTGLRGLLMVQLAGADIRILDVHATLDTVLAQPALFGFTNSTEACVTPGVAPYRCTNANQYVFWDGVHPTAALHALVARQAGAVLATP